MSLSGKDSRRQRKALLAVGAGAATVAGTLPSSDAFVNPLVRSSAGTAPPTSASLAATGVSTSRINGCGAAATGAAIFAAAAASQSRSRKSRMSAKAALGKETPAIAAEDVIYDLLQGNQRFMTGAGEKFKTGIKPSELLRENPMAPTVKKALVLSCAYLDVPLDAVFDVEAGQLLSVRVMGFVSGDHDGVMSSVDFALESADAPPVMIVLGDSDSEPLKAALRVAMKNAGLDAPAGPESSIPEEDLALVKQLLPACEDALIQLPGAPFEKLLEYAVKLNVWNTIENLMTNSPTVFSKVADGDIELHGAFIETETGAVQMLGQHPAQLALLSTPPRDDRVRVAASPSVPPQEARAALVAGNRRFSSKKGEIVSAADEFVLGQLGSEGQQPMASVLACSDSRQPVELNFDKRPGDLFVMRTAGNIIAGKGALLGSAEFAYAALKSKLLVVYGHNKCGAVTAAVKGVNENTALEDVPGSIGNLLAELMEAAQQSVKEKPDDDEMDQIQYAVRLNIFICMKRLLENSDILATAVKNHDLEIHGAQLDIFTGKIEWLGMHPDQEKIIGATDTLHQWQVAPYTHTVTPMGDKAKAVVDKLKAGNANFVAGTGSRFQPGQMSKAPQAIIVSGTEVKAKPQLLFDTAPGELVTQRCLGNIIGVPGGSLLNSLEYAVTRFNPPVLVVMGYSNDSVVKQALDQVQGSEVPPFAMRPVLDQVSVSAVRALEQVSQGEVRTSAGSSMKVMRLAVELNVLYAIEQLLLNSAVVRDAVKAGMEVQGAVLDDVTGTVQFMGPHPKSTEIVEIGDRRASG